jgi:hypothetical protein
VNKVLLKVKKEIENLDHIFIKRQWKNSANPKSTLKKDKKYLTKRKSKRKNRRKSKIQ